jgi:hypothetical protein
MPAFNYDFISKLLLDNTLHMTYGASIFHIGRSQVDMRFSVRSETGVDYEKETKSGANMIAARPRIAARRKP